MMQISGVVSNELYVAKLLLMDKVVVEVDEVFASFFCSVCLVIGVPLL